MKPMHHIHYFVDAPGSVSDGQCRCGAMLYPPKPTHQRTPRFRGILRATLLIRHAIWDTLAVTGIMALLLLILDRLH